MRARTRSLAILIVAAPAAAAAQGRAPQGRVPQAPPPAVALPRLETPRPAPPRAMPVLPAQPWTEPRVGIARRPAAPPGDGGRRRGHGDGFNDGFGGGFGDDHRDGGRHDGGARGGHRSRPIIVYVSPFQSYSSYYATPLGASSGWVSPLAPSYVTPAPRILAPEPVDSADDDTAYDAGSDARDVRPIEAAPSSRGAAAAIVVERAARDLVRVRWTGRDTSVREVELVVADAARRVIATQTVRRAPYTAVFDLARARYVGATLVRADGVSTTTLVPLALRPVVQTPIRRTSPGGPAR